VLFVEPTVDLPFPRVLLDVFSSLALLLFSFKVDLREPVRRFNAPRVFWTKSHRSDLLFHMKKGGGRIESGRFKGLVDAVSIAKRSGNEHCNPLCGGDEKLRIATFSRM
jgi:hypothetical protein